MRASRSLCIAALLWLCIGTVAHADNSTPVTVATPVPVVTLPPATLAPIATAVPEVPVATSPPPPVEDTTPVAITREHSTPVARVDQPSPPSQATAGPETQPTSSYYRPPDGSSPGAIPEATARPSAATPVQPPSPSDTAALAATAVASSSSSSTQDTTGYDTPAYSQSAQAPAQLICHGTQHGVAGPFMVAPYTGWTEVVSFVDHDSPDYTVDGKIVLANGLTATAANGQASDLFPAYWSPAMRQFVNYDGHNGYDLSLNYQPVLAAAAGTVQFAGWNQSDPYSGYGQMILINHHNGYVTLYGHLSKLEVKSGDKVTAGQEIAISGSTGHSSGPHLHFSVFHNCQVTDPYGWTGPGKDPLQDFDAEKASYLWLPGHDPLLLNPPPNWPSYPLGLHLTLPVARTAARVGARRVPPANRLLLLALPAPIPGQDATAGAALARTEASISQEAEALAPQLDDLKSQGIIDSYQVIPAAAAVWVHGIASASQLEGLPGVASLTGVEPHDLTSAQTGLAHAVLIQMGQQHAPSLWPAGFRAGLHTWRPTTTVMNGSALISGFTRPGQHVVITLERNRAVTGVAEAAGDPVSGGFVAMLHGPGGSPVSVRPHDVVQLVSAGRITRVPVRVVNVRARSARLSGSAPRDAVLSLQTLEPGGSDWTGVTGAGVSGKFQVDVRTHLAAGTLAVGTVANTAGDQEAVASFVPGLDVTEGSASVRGWTVGQSPRLEVRRQGQHVLQIPIHPAPDGTFQVDLELRGKPFVLMAGDAVALGSRWHQRLVKLPQLETQLSPKSHAVQVRGPIGSSVSFTYNQAGGGSWSRPIALGRTGERAIALPRGPVALGDSATVRYVSPDGNLVDVLDEVRGILIHQGTSILSGRVKPGSVLSIRALDARGNVLGTALVSAESVDGTFHASVKDSAGRAVRLLRADRIVIREGQAATTYHPPRLTLKVDVRNSRIFASGPRGDTALLALTFDRGPGKVRRVRLNGTAETEIPLSGWKRHHLVRAVLTWSRDDGLSVERTAALPLLLRTAISGGAPAIGKCSASRRAAATRHACSLAPKR